MKLKKFMMAGAASMLFAGAATAGVIKVEVTNVNSTGFNGVQEDFNIEMDTDEGSQSPGALGAVTVEEVLVINLHRLTLKLTFAKFWFQQIHLLLTHSCLRMIIPPLLKFR